MTTHLPGKFVWFEHVSNDIPRATAFYTALLGWKIEEMKVGDTPYRMIKNGTEGIGGFWPAEPNVPNHWISHLSVADVDAAARAAAAAGGKVVMPPQEFGSMGRGAMIADPTGATFGIWRGKQGDRPDVEKAAMGDWFWNEHMSKSAQKAIAFYEKAFGFTHEDMDMGPGGTYHVLKMNGVARAGLFSPPDAIDMAFWMPYVAVADCDASANKAKQLGGTVHVPPTDIPEVGRFAVVFDPVGACFGVIRPQMR